MTNPADAKSPYLKPNRLRDVITALQFLARHEDWRHIAEDWDKKLSSRPISVPGEEEERSWKSVFDEHPEFFRSDTPGHYSLVWRRALPKSPGLAQDKERPPLDDATIVKMIDIALALHSDAVDRNFAAVERATNRSRWHWQLALSILTAALAFAAAVVSAWIKVSGG